MSQFCYFKARLANGSTPNTTLLPVQYGPWRRTQLSTLLLLLSASTYASVEPASSDPAAPELEHIVIEGQRHPANGHVRQVDEKSMQSRLAATSDTAALLSGMAGVQLNGAGGVSSLPVIRGLADDRLRIKVDGMDLIAACPNHMNPPLSYLAPTDVGQIGVFAGLSPVSVGGDSIGGSIIAESKQPEFTTQSRFQGQVGAFYRSNNAARGANLQLQHSSEKLFISYSGNHNQAENYRAGGDFLLTPLTGRQNHQLELNEVGSTAFKSQNHQFRLVLQTGHDLIDLQLGMQDMPYQLYPNQRMDLLDNQQQRANLSWRRELAWGAVQTRAYHENVEHLMDFGPDKQFWYGSLAMGGRPCTPIRFTGDPLGTCAAGMPMISESSNTGLSAQFEIQQPNDALSRFGFELQQFDLDDYWPASGSAMGPDIFWNIQQGQRDRLAIFAEQEHIMERWHWLYGARVEQVKMNAQPVHGYSSAANAMGMQASQAAQFNAAKRDSTDYNSDLTLLASYRVHPQLDAEIGFARKVRSPNLYEKYTWSSWSMAAAMNNLVGDGNGYVGNLQLKPEQAHTLSTSLIWQNHEKTQKLQVKPYWTEVNDYIDAIATSGWVADKFNVLKYANQDARITGIDLSWQHQLTLLPLGDWDLQAELSYTRSTNKDSGQSLYQVVPFQGQLVLQQQFGAWHNRLEWAFAARKDRLSSIRNEIETAGYQLFHLRFSHQWQAIRLDFGAENLFDRLYFLPSGGTYTGQGMTMSLNGIPYGLAVPGMGRSIYAGLNYRF